MNKPAAPPRLSLVQRKILTYMLDREKATGGATLIASGQKKTRAGYFPALKEEGICTNSTTLYFLRQNGLVEDAGDNRYRLSQLGRAALKGKP